MSKKNKEKSEKKVKGSGKGEKFADMSAEAVVIEEPTEEELTKEVKVSKVSRVSKVRGKKYLAAKKLVDQSKIYPVLEAFELLKKVAVGSFKQTVELHLNVLSAGLSGDVSLPHFQGKEKVIAIFNDELAAEIKSGKINFDILLATPADMPKIMPLAKVLGPKGLLPNPKNGTIVPDPQKAVANFKTGGIHYKTERDFPIIHAVIGKLDQPTEELVANYEAFIKSVQPKNIKKTFIKSTMSPSIHINFS